MDFIQETSSPSLRSSSKRISYNSRQSGDYIPQVRSLPSSNPIKQPLIEHSTRNRVASTENPRKTVLKEDPPLLLKANSQNSNVQNEYFNENNNKIDRVAEDMNRKYKGLEDRLAMEIERLAKDLKIKDMELENMREKLQFKEKTLEDFERKIENLNNEVVRKNDDLLRKFAEKNDFEVFLNKEEIIRQLQEKNQRNEAFLEKANVLLREKDIQLQEMAAKMVILNKKTEEFIKMDDLLKEKEAFIRKLEENNQELIGKNESLIQEIANINGIILEKQDIIDNLTEITNKKAKNIRFSDFLHEKHDDKHDEKHDESIENTIPIDSIKENQGFSPEKHLFTSKTLEETGFHDSPQKEKVKRAFVGESQHLQETIKTLNKSLDDITRKYEDLLKEQGNPNNNNNNSENKTFLYKESLENKTFPFERGTFGSNTTIFNDRFFGEQIQGILNKNRTLKEENSDLLSQNEIKQKSSNNIEKMNKISREKIQENEKLKKKISDLERIIEDLKQKITISIGNNELINENLDLKSRIPEIEVNFIEKFEEEVSRMKSDFDIEIEKLSLLNIEKLQLQEQDFLYEFEMKNQEIIELMDFLQEFGENEPKIKAFLLERGENEKKRRFPIEREENFSEITTNFALKNSELAQEKYHRKTLESLLDLLRKKLMELSHHEEISGLLKELENFTISEENPFEELQEKTDLISNLKTEIAVFKDNNEKSLINIEDSGFEIAMKRALFMNLRENSRLTHELRLLTEEYQALTNSKNELEVLILDNFGSKAEKLVRENRLAQLFKRPILQNQDNNEIAIIALRKTLEDITNEYLEYKRKWIIISESIDMAISEKEEISGNVLTTYWTLKEEKNDKEFNMNIHFLEEFNKKSHLLAINNKTFNEIKMKLKDFGYKMSQKHEDNEIQQELLAIIDEKPDFLMKSVKSEEFSSEKETSRDREFEELRLKYVENALILEELRAENAIFQNNDKKNIENSLNLGTNFNEIEILAMENKELREKLEEMNVFRNNMNNNSNISLNNSEIGMLKIENEEIRGKYGLLEGEINDLKGLYIEERREKDRIYKENEGFREENSDLLRKIKEITKENEDILRENADIIENGKNMQKTISGLIKNNKNLNENMNKLEEYKEKYEEIYAKHEDLQEKAKNLEIFSKENKDLKEKLDILYENMKDFEVLSKENHRLSLEIDDLNSQLKPDVFPLKSPDEKSLLEFENKELKEKSLYESLISKSQLEELKDQFSKVVLRLQQFEEEGQKLSNQNQELLIENKHLKEGLSMKENINDNEGLIINKENQRLFDENKRFHMENQELNKKIASLLMDRECFFKDKQEILLDRDSFLKEKQQFSIENQNLLSKINAFYLENQELKQKLAFSSKKNQETPEIDNENRIFSEIKTEIIDNNSKISKPLNKKTNNEEFDRLCELHTQELLNFNSIKASFFDSMKTNEFVRDFLQEKLELLLNSHAKLTEFTSETSYQYQRKIQSLSEELASMNNEFRLFMGKHQDLQENYENLQGKYQEIEAKNEFHKEKHREIESLVFRISQNQTKVIAKYLNLILEIENNIRENEGKSMKNSSFQFQNEEEDPFSNIFQRLADDIHELLDSFNTSSLKNAEIKRKSLEIQRIYEENAGLLREKEANIGKLTELVEKLELLLKENEKLTETIDFLRVENNDFKSQKAKNSELQALINDSRQEITNLIEINKELIDKKSYNGLKTRIMDLENDLEAKRTENRDIKREKEGIIEKWEGDNRFSEAQIRQLKVIITNLKDEVKNCYKLLTEKRNEREQLMQTVKNKIF